MEGKDKKELIEKLVDSLKDCDQDDLLNYAKKYWESQYKNYSDKDLLIEYRGIYGEEYDQGTIRKDSHYSSEVAAADIVALLKQGYLALCPNAKNEVGGDYYGPTN